MAADDSRLSTLRTFLRVTGGYEAACDAVAIAAMIAAVALPGRGVAVTLAWLALAMSVALPVRKALTQDLSVPGLASVLVGFGQSARILVVLTAVVLRDIAGAPPWESVACYALALLMLIERSVRRPVGSSVPLAANLPAGDLPLPSTRIANALFWMNSLATAVLLGAATLRYSLWPLVLLLIPAAALAITTVVQVTRYRILRRRFEVNLPRIVAGFAPEFCFHWQAPGGTTYQASMWLPYLDRIDTPYFVLVRTPVNLEEISEITSAPVIYRPGLSDLDAIVTPSLRVVFYCNTAVRNSHMIRFPQLTHIQLNHGDSDKVASVSPTFRQYDKNFVAGEAAVDRFAKHGVATLREQFELVGRPQLEGVQPARGPISELESKTVLYSPTWSGFYEDSDYSSLPIGPAIVQSLLDRGCTVVFRPHPYARRHRVNEAACDAIIALLEKDAKATGRSHRWGPLAEREMSIFDCFNASDAMISDVSSVASDYLFSGKPFAMVAVSSHGAEFVDEFPLAGAAYVFDMVKRGAEGLEPALDDMLGEDSLRATRQALRSYYLGDATSENCAEPFLAAARKYISEPGGQHG